MKTPLHLWIIGGLTLFWNLVGAADYTLTQMKAPFYLAQFTPEQAAYFDSFPTWVQASWATAVWFAVLGSLLLLLRHGAAVLVFAIAFVAMVATAVHNFALGEVRLNDIAGPNAIWFSLAIFLIGGCEWAYARRMRQIGILT